MQPTPINTIFKALVKYLLRSPIAQNKQHAFHLLIGEICVCIHFL